MEENLKSDQSVSQAYPCVVQKSWEISRTENDFEVKYNSENLEIKKVFENLNSLLQYKNAKYGSSGLEPLKIFSKTDATTGLLQRIDDKIARIKNSDELRKNDVADLTGYLALLCVTKGWDNFDEFKD